jgi:hypothetical protein
VALLNISEVDSTGVQNTEYGYCEASSFFNELGLTRLISKETPRMSATLIILDLMANLICTVDTAEQRFPTKQRTVQSAGRIYKHQMRKMVHNHKLPRAGPQEDSRHLGLDRHTMTHHSNQLAESKPTHLSDHSHGNRLPTVSLKQQNRTVQRHAY